MASLAPNPDSDKVGRVRRGAATPASTCRFAESFRFLPAERYCSFRNRTRQWWFTVADRLQPRHEAEGMDLASKERLSVSALCPVNLSPRGSDHSRQLTDV